jgi:exopolysaccharide biosynthesis polyprenyl glycosylphosphotransferase
VFEGQRGALRAIRGGPSGEISGDVDRIEFSGMIAPRDRSATPSSSRLSARHVAAHGGRTDVLTLVDHDTRTVDDAPPGEAFDAEGGRVVVERVDVDVLRLERLSVTTDDGVREPSALRTGPISLTGPVPEPTAPWLPRFVAVLVVLDVAAFLLGGLIGALLSSRDLAGAVPVRTAPVHSGISYLGVLLLAVPAWVLGMAGSRAYEGRCLGLGSEEFRRVGNAAARFTAVLAIVVFLFKADLARGLIVLALPAATVCALVFRYLARQVLHRVRSAGHASHRVLVVGEGRARDVLAAKLQASPHSGLRVVGVCRPALRPARGEVSVDHVRQVVASVEADTVAVAHSDNLTPEVLRRIAWTLEGTGVDLLVAPALTDVAGPRIHVRPVSGLPLLQIAEPEFTGGRRVVKGTIDVVGAIVLLVLLSPLLLATAVIVRATSPGPVFFRQTRVGRDGVPFRMWKFRSMFIDAERRLEELRHLNDHGESVLFKMRDDPRVTGIGRILRRYSIDELPQLFNVLAGQMSLVGPRPPLPSEVARYERDVHRRLLVKPGLTGLWQVSGRSDLDWTETVRLDLYYVENWSVALDAEILWKTVSAVLRGSGAR